MDHSALAWALSEYAQRSGTSFDSVRLHVALSKVKDASSARDALSAVTQSLGIRNAAIAKVPDVVLLPMLTWHANRGWGVVIDRTPDGQWHVISPDEEYWAPEVELIDRTATLALQQGNGDPKITHSFSQELREAIREHRGILGEGVFASLMLGLLTVVTSLYSMQVYDRVIPTRNGYTLAVLCMGVLIMVVIDLAVRFSRARIMDTMIIGIDAKLSRQVFQRLLAVRLDQFPKSVGSLAAELRGYETVRSFYTASTLFTLADLPVSLLLLALIAVIASPVIALVPLTAAIIALALGFYYRKRLNELASKSAADSYMKTGVLVETVEGIETIKSGGGNWKFLSRWMDLTGRSIHNDLKSRHASENLGYFTNTLQQISYIGIITLGAVLAIDGVITMGALIACSILGGRVMAPITAIPGLLVQKSYSDAARKGIDALYSREVDNHAVARPLTPATLTGQYRLENVGFRYSEKDPPIEIQRLEIQPGDRVAVVGRIGSGKSTLLRLLSGLYKPQLGKVLLDGLDMAHISANLLSRNIGYLQQEHRLFMGTLRENLLIGLPDPPDALLRDAMIKTGLIHLVANHPLGINLPISEGGKGLSGGQRQLVTFTRILLMNPSILLLDEPTASMDDAQERQCLAVLKEHMDQEDGLKRTLIVVTHRTSILPFVDKLIVMSDGKVAMAGAKDAVLDALRENEKKRATQIQVQTPNP